VCIYIICIYIFYIYIYTQFFLLYLYVYKKRLISRSPSQVPPLLTDALVKRIIVVYKDAYMQRVKIT